jgi:hypothetical protein
MTPRFTLVALLLLSQTGCVAAIPMIAQLATSPNSSKQLCEFTKMSGHSPSFCDPVPLVQNTQKPEKAPHAARLDTAAR